MTAPTSILKASKICKTFYAPTAIKILKEIDFEIKPGQSVAITGKSGEGKSTLLHILGTLDKPCSGTLEICGQEINKKASHTLRNRHIGFIFQSYNLLEDYTTLDNVLMPARIARSNIGKGSHAYTRALMLLETVGLKQRALFPAKLLSGGERQRAAIARSLINDPDLILADEPSGNLDTIHSQEVHALLLRLAREYNKALIVVTHDKELSLLCDKTLLLKEGNLSTISLGN